MLQYRRMAIERESPEQLGYNAIRYNLAESSVPDFAFGQFSFNLSDLVLAYGDHIGHPNLRQLIAAEHGLASPDHVLLTAGAASALFIVATALLAPSDHLLVMMPNYATNIETPRAIGCQIEFLSLSIDTDFALNVAQISQKIKPNTRLISITTPHNPSGKMMTLQQLNQLAQIANQHGIYLLVDETYRDLSLPTSPTTPPLAATLSDRVISISSLSKAYGLPGIRIGWIVCQNAQVMETFLAAKEQIFICNSVLDEEIAYQVYSQKTTLLSQIQTQTAPKFELLKEWLANEKRLDYRLPEGGVVCFPRINSHCLTPKFYDDLLHKYQTYVGPGHWFNVPDNYFRIGFAWPTIHELEAGLSAISKALQQ